MKRPPKSICTESVTTISPSEIVRELTESSMMIKSKPGDILACATASRRRTPGSPAESPPSVTTKVARSVRSSSGSASRLAASRRRRTIAEAVRPESMVAFVLRATRPLRSRRRPAAPRATRATRPKRSKKVIASLRLFTSRSSTCVSRRPTVAESWPRLRRWRGSIPQCSRHRMALADWSEPELEKTTWFSAEPSNGRSRRSCQRTLQSWRSLALPQPARERPHD